MIPPPPPLCYRNLGHFVYLCFLWDRFNVCNLEVKVQTFLWGSLACKVTLSIKTHKLQSNLRLKSFYKYCQLSDHVLTFTPVDPLSPTGPSGPLRPYTKKLSCHWWIVAFNRPAAHVVWVIELGQLISIFVIPIKWSLGGSFLGFIVHCGLAFAVETPSKIVAILQILGIWELALKHAQSTVCRLCPHLSMITHSGTIYTLGLLWGRLGKRSQTL